MAAPAVHHLPQAGNSVGIFPQMTARQSETLVLKEKMLSLTGDSFDIKLANGQPILRVQGKALSISGRKSVYDMAGNHLFDIAKEHLHIHTTFVAQDPQGNKIMEVKSSFARESWPFHYNIERETERHRERERTSRAAR